jgi:hypothetical protein
MVVAMITGAIIALIFFVTGFLACLWFKDICEVEEEEEQEVINEVSTPTDGVNTTDIFRIKAGPKKGLLSYKKAREA